MLEPLTQQEFAYAAYRIVGKTDLREMLNQIKKYKKVYDAVEVLKK